MCNKPIFLTETLVRRSYMTTIIVVVVVALVFFVAVCVVTFMIWKRESEMRTDSIRAIEHNLEKLTSEISQDPSHGGQKAFGEGDRAGAFSYMDSVIAESMPTRSGKRRSYDPFGWVREEDTGQEAQTAGSRYVCTETAAVEEPIPEEELICECPEEPCLEEAPGIIEYEQQPCGEICTEKSSESSLGSVSDEAVAVTEKQDVSAEQTDDREPEADGDMKEISLDFMEEPGLLQQDAEYEPQNCHKRHMEYDVGRSGRKYTATELETLIKE